MAIAIFYCHLRWRKYFKHVSKYSPRDAAKSPLFHKKKGKKKEEEDLFGDKW